MDMPCLPYRRRRHWHRHTDHATCDICALRAGNAA